MAISSNAHSGPRLVVTSASTFWKRSEVPETDATLNSLALVKESQGDRVEVGAALYSEPLKHGVVRRLKGSLRTLGGIAAGLGITAGCAVLAGAMSPILALGLTAALPIALMGGVAGEEAKGHASRPHPLQTGVSVQHSQLNVEYQSLNEDSGPADALREVAITNLKAYPSAFQVVHLNGHGFGAQSVAGLPGDQADQALQKAVVLGGRKFDIAIYESCLNGNFEQLNAAADSADYALAFEDLVPKSNSQAGRIPLQTMLEQATESVDPRAAVVQMARSAGEFFERDKTAAIASVPWNERGKPVNKEALWRNPDTTVGAFDLTALRHELAPALNTLGKALAGELPTNSSLRYAVKSARYNNEIEVGGDLIDMGGFLKDLKSETTGATAEAVDGALRALGKATLHLRTGKTLPMSGLSFHSKPHQQKNSDPTSDAYAGGAQPEGWAKFVERHLG